MVVDSLKYVDSVKSGKHSKQIERDEQRQMKENNTHNQFTRAMLLNLSNLALKDS